MLLLLSSMDNKQLFQLFQHSSFLQYHSNMFLTTC